MSYAEALERAEPPHKVLLGPAPCHRCGAWVEWAGADWLALGTAERHDCAPFLQAHEPDPELVTAWTRPTTGLRQAHLEPVPWAEPRWMRRLGAAILWVALFFAAAFAVALAARAVGGGW